MTALVQESVFIFHVFIIPGSSDVVDLTLEPNSPTRSNFVDLTGEAVEQMDSNPVIVVRMKYCTTAIIVLTTVAILPCTTLAYSIF